MSVWSKFGASVPKRLVSRVRKAIDPLYDLDLAIEQDEPELAILSRVVRPDTLALDVGANRGMYSRALTKAGAKVIAFEPIPALAANLERVFAKWPVSVRNIALSAANGNAQLTVPKRHGKQVFSRASLLADANPGFELETISVELGKLDDLKLPKVSVLKIDVEGHEFDVLKGGEQTIRRDRPLILVEIEERHHPDKSQEILDWVSALGYNGYFFHRDSIRPIRDYDFSEMQSPANAKLPGGQRNPDYINNFFFVAPGSADEARLSA